MGISRNRPKSDEEIKKFKEDYDNYSINELSSMYKSHRTSILNWAKDFNFPKKPRIGPTRSNLSTLPNITQIVDNSLNNFKLEDHPDIQAMVTEYEVMQQQKRPRAEIADLAMRIIGVVTSKSKVLGDVVSGMMAYVKMYMDEQKVKLIEKNKEKDLDQDYLVALKRRLIDSFLNDVKSLVDEPDRIEFMRILTVAVKRQVKKTIKEMNIPEIVDVNTPIEKAIEIMRKQGRMSEAPKPELGPEPVSEDTPGTVISWQEFKKMFPENVIQDFKL